MTTRPKKRTRPGGIRREAMIEAAWGLFMEKGYASVPVDEIIKRSGGSKASFYDFFGSKEGLFREIVASVSKDALKHIRIDMPPDVGPREALTGIGVAFATEILTGKGVDLYRLSVSVSKDFPKIARMFYETGPLLCKNVLAKYLKDETEAGRLSIKDPLLAAEFFFCMILLMDHVSIPLGCQKKPTKQGIRRKVEEAVDVFLAAYGKK